MIKVASHTYAGVPQSNEQIRELSAKALWVNADNVDIPLVGGGVRPIAHLSDEEAATLVLVEGDAADANGRFLFRDDPNPLGTARKT